MAAQNGETAPKRTLASIAGSCILATFCLPLAFEGTDGCHVIALQRR